MILEAILLGLSTGTYCTMYCAPVLIPFLSGTEKVSYKRNSGLIGAFLGGRLVTYFILGAVFAAVGLLVNEFMDSLLAHKLSVYAYLLCGLSLLVNSLGIKFPWGCSDGCRLPKLRRIGNDWVTSIFAAIVRSVFGGKGLSGFFYFIFFYIGTLPFFIPLFGIPFVAKRLPAIKKVARVTQVCVSIYFMIFLGLIPLIFG